VFSVGLFLLRGGFTKGQKQRRDIFRSNFATAEPIVKQKVTVKPETIALTNNIMRHLLPWNKKVVH